MCHMTVEEAIAKRQKYLHPVMGAPYYPNPVLMTHGKGQHVFDESGNKLLDLYGGVCTTSVGHNHPRVVKAAEEQLKKIWHVPQIYLQEKNAELAEFMVKKMPQTSEWVVFFTNSGGESTEFAILNARVHSKQNDYITLRTAYHGLSGGSSRATTACAGFNWKAVTDPCVKHAMTPDLFKGVFRSNDPKAVDKYLSDLESTGNDLCSSVAGFGVEPFQGVGGVIEMPEGYIKKSFEIIKSLGGVCIADEVQTGWGRTGETYWGFQKDQDGADPDIVVTAKSIANGWPLGAVIVKKEIADSLTGSNYFNTYGGNPVACAVALETLRVIESEKLQENSDRQGDIILNGLRSLQDQYPNIISDVRGRGLMIGFEISKDGDPDSPNPVQATAILNGLRNESILVGKGGYKANVIRVKPPLVITDEDSNLFLDKMETILAKLS